MRSFTPSGTKICEICGEEFTPESRAQKICKREHTCPCPICGKPVPVRFKSEIALNKCCSKECSSVKRRNTSVIVWGTDNPAKCQTVKDKQAATCLERYGSTSPFTAPDFEDKRKKTCEAKYGVDHPMKSEMIKHKHSKSCSDNNGGIDSPLKLPKVRSAMLDVYKDAGRMMEIAAKRLDTMGKVAALDGTHLDSSYELQVYEFCKRNNLEVERQIPIKYNYNGCEHTTFIDFKINGMLFECKGGHLLEGCYDNSDASNLIPIDVKLDVYRKNHVIIVTDNLGRQVFSKYDSNGLLYESKCKYPLIGVDVSLFNNNLVKFPYRSDRPKCFYDVRVDGMMSSHDAFFNESIRWSMIHNRIMYVGGFIDAKSILTALNVTRTCKQPSWFSKALAKEIIQKYCTSDTIVDICAGWGARHDAACELRRNYIGCDFNKELVDWHQSLGRNITFEDARKFTYSGECSVFTCPPYSDPKTGKCFEDYNFDGFDNSAKSMTQCDWLKVAMQNVPNANEYVMVCKIVDEGWEKYVVDTKVNKSHFGTNREYVVVVPQSEKSNLLIR